MTNLEIKLTFLEDTVDSLNETIIEQGKRMDTLLAQVEALRTRLEEQDGPGIVDERPPHY